MVEWWTPEPRFCLTNSTRPRDSHLLQFVPTNDAVTDAGLITSLIQRFDSTRKKNENDDLMVYPIFIQTALDALIHSLIHSPLVSWLHPNLWPWQVLSSWKCSLHLSCSEDVNGSQRIFSRQTSLELGGPLMIHSAKSDILSP